jgi:glycerophosphoryl diester phosphodiesterase
LIRAVLQDFQRTWPQLLAADLLARAVAFIVLTPSAALILRLLIRRSGSQVIADQDILHFLLTPLGVVTLAVAGAAALAIFLAALALLMTIGLGATRDRLVSYLAAGRFVGRRARGLASLSVHVVLRLLLVAAPFAAAIGLIFVVVLGRHDIYFYLNVKPAEFWIAAALTVLVLLAAARILVPIVLAWTFALPILLFEDATARQALARSQTETPNHRLRIALWLLGWLALTTALGTVASGTVLWVGQRVLPVSQSLPLIAAFLAGILGAPPCWPCCSPGSTRRSGAGAQRKHPCLPTPGRSGHAPNGASRGSGCCGAPWLPQSPWVSEPCCWFATSRSRIRRR